MKQRTTQVGIWIFLLWLFAVGCSSFTQNANKATARVDDARKAETEIEDSKTDTARAYVYGAGEALRAPEGAPVASGLVRRASLTLGPPSMEDAQTMDKVVSGLLSEEQQARKAAEARLATLDARVVGLEKQLAAAQKVTERAEERRDGVLAEASKFADKYLAARRWVLWLVGGYLAWRALPILLTVAGSFAGGPLGGAIASGFGNIIRSIGSAVPGALEKAGAVAAAEHQTVAKALENVAVSVERYKRQYPEAKARLGAILLDETSRDHDRPVIEAALAKNKHRIK